MIAELAALLAVCAPTTAAHRTAVVVGVNQAFDAGQATLRYADDDAARFFELFRGQVDHLELLTIVDAESQRLYPTAAAAAHVPDDAELTRALDRAHAAGRAARSAGRRAELYFVYVGHGRVQGGEGEVKLFGGTLNRTQLAERVLSPRSHDRTHLIIDACNAYHLVNARGPANEVTMAFEADFDRFVAEQSLSRFPTLGVVLSTSGIGATHEWSRFQGGVFSHEIRSALAGAADVDGDDQIDYTEIEAFAAAANLKIPELKGRPKIFVRAPAIERGAALLSLPPQRPRLRLPSELNGHFYVEDDRGLRYAELNKAAGFVVALRLVPRESYQLVDASGAPVARFERPSGTLSVRLPLTPIGAPRLARGEDRPPGAFSEPFGPRFVDGFRASRRDLVARPHPAVKTSAWMPVAAYTAGAVGVLAAGGALWQGNKVDRAYGRYLSAFDENERDGSADDMQTARNRAIGLGVTAGVTLAIGATFYFWDRVFD